MRISTASALDVTMTARGLSTLSETSEKQPPVTVSSLGVSVSIWPVNTPPAKAGGFRLRLKAGLIGHSADSAAHTT